MASAIPQPTQPTMKGHPHPAAKGDGATALRQLPGGQRRLRLVLAASALLSVSLTLPVLLVSDLRIDRSLREIGSGIGAARAPSIGDLISRVVPPRRQMLGGDEQDFDIMDVEDDVNLLPLPPPLPGAESAKHTPDPPPPYSLDNVLESMNYFKDTFAVVVYDPPSDKFIVHYPSSMRWISACHKLVNSFKIVAHSLRTILPDRFTADSPEFAMAISSADFPGVKWTDCLRGERLDCLDGADPEPAPVLHFGSVFRRPILPFIVGMPMPQNNHLSCFHYWMMHEQVCHYYLPRGPDNPEGLVFGDTVGLGWDDLIPQVVWRGTDFSYLRKMDPSLSPPDFEIDVAEMIDLSGRVDKKTAATQAMRRVYDVLIPRWKGVVLTAEAEREAEALDQQNLNRNKRVNKAAQREVLRNKKRARVPENYRPEDELLRLRGPAVPWANIKFSAGMHAGKKTPVSDIEAYRQFEEHGIPAVGEGMSLEELARYKYHIDLGGGGGTTWSGTLEKLGLPGLLFHHVTPTKDYLHDMLVPWVHYVPVRADLSDLREKFEWAERHPNMARQISDEATLLARSLGTPEGMGGMFLQFYESKFQQVVEAYRPLEGGAGAWREAMAQGVEGKLRPIMECGGYYHHLCKGLVDDISFAKLHDRDAGASG